jgi:cation:H+ antiporter
LATASQEIGSEDEPRCDEHTTVRLTAYIVLCALLILAAGFVLSATADRIASETGLQSGMVGFILVGFATSLPEVSSITAAVRMRRHQLAIVDVFGTNIFNILLIVLADAVYQGEPVLAQAGRFEVIGATLAVFMTGIFVIGLLERRDETIVRMGYDAFASVSVFGLGLWLLSRAID